MKLNIIDYNVIIEFKEGKIPILLMESKTLFYNLILELYNINEGLDNKLINFFENDNELNISKKMCIINDYFNIDFNTKNVLSKLYERIDNELLVEDKNKIQLLINDIIRLYNAYLSNIDLDLEYNDSISFIELCKLLKLKVSSNKESLLEKIMLIVDIESQLHINKLIVFINLKQYLNKHELESLYEYIFAKKVTVLLIENTNDILIDEEEKYIIDQEFSTYVFN